MQNNPYQTNFPTNVNHPQQAPQLFQGMPNVQPNIPYFAPQGLVFQQQMMPVPQMHQVNTMQPAMGPVAQGFAQRGSKFEEHKMMEQQMIKAANQQRKFMEAQEKAAQEQRLKMAEDLKQRAFLEQKRKLAEFHSAGRKKKDADSMINSIIGEAKSVKPQTHPPPPKEDDFGSFLSANIPTATTPAQIQPAATASGIQIIEKAAPKSQTKDLKELMESCSDLAVQQKAQKFAKQTLSNTQTTKVKVANFQQSQKARTWSATASNFEDLFKADEPQLEPNVETQTTHFSQPPPVSQAPIPVAMAPVKAPPSAAAPVAVGGQQLPNAPWLMGAGNVPQVYYHVLEASVRDGHIDTGALYPILMRSNLSREILGKLWSLANIYTPGKLTKPELFAILALIALTQNNVPVSSVADLANLPTAPEPFLGQHSDNQEHHATSQVVTTSDALLATASVTSHTELKPIPLTTSNSKVTVLANTITPRVSTTDNVLPAPKHVDESFAAVADEFEDFQTGPKTFPEAFPVTSTTRTTTITASSSSADNSLFQSASSQKPASSVADKYASLKELISDSSLFKPAPAADVTKANDDDWQDFNAAPLTTAPSNDNAGDLVGIATDIRATGKSEQMSEGEKTSEGDWANFATPAPAFPTHSLGGILTPSIATSNVEQLTADPVPLSIDKDVSVSASRSSEKAPDFSRKNKGLSHQKYFARNLTLDSVAGSGMSPFDTIPPDMPSETTDQSDSSFDKFGTFNIDDNEAFEIGKSTINIGLDDFGDDMNHGAKNAYTGIRSLAAGFVTSKSGSAKAEDSEETQNEASDNATLNVPNHLEFHAKYGDSASSPASGDNQSVSSLDSNKQSFADALSVASLELKPVSNDDIQLNTTVEDKALKPRAAAEILAEQPVIGGDRYSGIRDVASPSNDSARNVAEWRRLLERADDDINQCVSTFHGITDSEVAGEVVQSEEGTAYLKAVVEVYKLANRIHTAMKEFALMDNALVELMKNLEQGWANLTVFIAGTHIMPERGSLDYSSCATDAEDAKSRVCGVCLLDVRASARACADDGLADISYGGVAYHAACGNYYINRINSTLPALKIPELL